MNLSVIIPTFNEAAEIGACLNHLQALRARGCEISVVDGGSTDDTAALARPHADRVIITARGRALQMNSGAQAANAEVLLFLHADARLAENADAAILEGLRRSGKSWGHFDVRISSRHPLLRMVESLMNLRSRVTKVATGDQGLFVTRELFHAIGGFPPIALMEDIALSKILRQHGAPLCLKKKISVSARRWETRGVWRTIFLMWRLRLAYFLGADPKRLALAYDERKY
ncbi:MAG: TIGR04283 family arsenosugar biosynthesis glycosyltransferase [Burkholderiales bacterium]